jgi:hypothetical protein
VRKIIFDGLLGPGAQLAIPEIWPQINAEMQSHRECLVHGDLWSKNLLVKQGAPVAVVDFEGVHYGDPAFDLGTLAAVALLPAVEDDGLVFAALDFIARLLHAWKTTCGSETWWEQVSPRVLTATAVFLATRGFGPFAYKMNPAAQGRLLRLVRSLAAEPPVDLESFASRVKQFIGPSTSME